MKILLLTLLFHQHYIEIPLTHKYGITFSIKGSAEYSDHELEDHLKLKFAVTYKL